MSPRGYARVTAVLFAAEAVFAIVHRLSGGEYPGFVHAHTVVIDVGLASVWGVGALSGLIHRSWPGLFWTLVASAVSLMHGVMFSVAMSDHGPYGVGIPFLVAGGLGLYCAVHAAPAFLAKAPEESPAVVRGAWTPGLRHAHGHSHG